MGSAVVQCGNGIIRSRCVVNHGKRHSGDNRPLARPNRHGNAVQVFGYLAIVNGKAVCLHALQYLANGIRIDDALLRQRHEWPAIQIGIPLRRRQMGEQDAPDGGAIGFELLSLPREQATRTAIFLHDIGDHIAFKDAEMRDNPISARQPTQQRAGDRNQHGGRVAEAGQRRQAESGDKMAASCRGEQPVPPQHAHKTIGRRQRDVQPCGMGA